MEIAGSRLAGRLAILGLVGVAVYAAAMSMLFPTLGSPGQGMPMEGNFVASASSLALGLAGMAAASLFLFRGPGRGAYSRDFAVAETSIMKDRASASDEARLLEKVSGIPGGITQDALRFRTGWTRERIESVLGSLERSGKVSIEDFGSTRKVFARDRGSANQGE